MEVFIVKNVIVILGDFLVKMIMTMFRLVVLYVEDYLMFNKNIKVRIYSVVNVNNRIFFRLIKNVLEKNVVVKTLFLLNLIINIWVI